MKEPGPFDSDDARRLAILHRDPEADGHFFYGVKTTGVYCRPVCPSRAARPENMVFFASTDAAEAAGFRPCKRCRPDRAPGKERQRLITDLCRHIERAEKTPTLDQLATKAGLSRHHLQRLFKSVTGVTPRAYALAHRGKRVRESLKREASVTDAIYASGYESSGRFYEDAGKRLGMTPSVYRSGGKNLTLRFAIGEASLGHVLVAQSDRGICAILLGDEEMALKRELRDQFPAATLKAADPGFEKVVRQVIRFVEKPNTGFDLPLDIQGTAFQQRVWQALREIPAGETASYRDIARRIGSPKAVRAVAGACAANHLAVAVPCHRVVKSDGAISGYRWGVERKRELLAREKREPEGDQ